MPSSDEILNRIFKLDAVFSIVSMILMIATIFVFGPLRRRSPHWLWLLDEVFFLDLHQDSFSRHGEGGIGIEPPPIHSRLWA